MTIIDNRSNWKSRLKRLFLTKTGRARWTDTGAFEMIYMAQLPWKVRDEDIAKLSRRATIQGGRVDLIVATDNAVIVYERMGNANS